MERENIRGDDPIQLTADLQKTLPGFIQKKRFVLGAVFESKLL